MPHALVGNEVGWGPMSRLGVAARIVCAVSNQSAGAARAAPSDTDSATVTGVAHDSMRAASGAALARHVLARPPSWPPALRA